ncbi:hypothetical protein DPMN_025349 [Dreissena polymorpha]|uniref:Uncharacterized protein n=1 Tax=Dreissena polymorpha TaxID=45954 RepID=A0A9D4LRE5_DREPO|nr:hypothetical protein DPMN_025349 [Dreissena polymorpha]
MSIVIELTRTAPVGPPGAYIQDNPSPCLIPSSSSLTSCFKASLNNTILLECLSMLSFYKLFSTTAMSLLIDPHWCLSSKLSSCAVGGSSITDTRSYSSSYGNTNSH